MNIQIKDNKIYAPLKDKWLVLKPEEEVRQRYICRLVESYGYDLKQMEQELKVTNSQRGQGAARADIVIWKSVIETITASTRNIFWGCGANTSVKFLYMGTWYSSHNMILELMLRGGTGALLAYMFVIICCKKRNSKYMQNKYNYYLNIILFFSLCASMTETPVFSPYIFVIMTFINMADVIILIEKARNR